MKRDFDARKTKYQKTIRQNKVPKLREPELQNYQQIQPTHMICFVSVANPVISIRYSIQLQNIGSRVLTEKTLIIHLLFMSYIAGDAPFVDGILLLNACDS